MLAQAMGARRHNTGKRIAVRANSGELVYPSSPEQGVGPTNPVTTGQTPEACPPISLPKTGRGSGRSPEAGEGRRAAETACLDEHSISQLLEFFRLLDSWDRQEAHDRQIM